MNQLSIAGIRRGNQFSPNHIGNDAAIFSLTAKHLHTLGCEVHEYIESDLIINDLKEHFIFNMVRDWRSIHKLQRMEEAGCIVINSAFGIENCTREKMTRLLIDHHIPHPKSLILPTDTDPTEALKTAGLNNCWIKRGDFHAIHREDVTYVRNVEEAASIFKEYAIRGIPTAVVNEHLSGDLVKFYGIAGSDFFYWFYPSNEHHSKFGLEAINGRAQGISFDENEMKHLVNEAAHVLNTDIYGGDCIVAANGSIRLIDFNDWPSFAPCRDEAAPYIARHIFDRFQTVLSSTL